MLKTAIVALALAGAAWGCADGGDPAGRDATGGSAGAALAGGTGGSQASGGQIGTGGAGSAAGAPGTGGASPAGTGGALATGGQPGTGGAAGAGTGTPPTCESLGWSPGSASLCGASKGGLECAYCDLPAPPRAGAEPDCRSGSAFQGAAVLCVTSCASCK